MKRSAEMLFTEEFGAILKFHKKTCSLHYMLHNNSHLLQGEMDMQVPNVKHLDGLGGCRGSGLGIGGWGMGWRVSGSEGLSWGWGRTGR